MGVRFVVLGKQGAGKGTQCVRLSHHYVVPHISTGDMFRAAVKSGTEIGKQVQAIIESGDLVPDAVVMEVVAERLERDGAKRRGFILDGFPRSLVQAEMLAAFLAPEDLDLAVDISVPSSLILRRLTGRRVCTDCGAIYHVNARPKVDWICDLCGGEVVQRDDDTEEAIRRRLALYEHETAPLVAWYEQRSQLVSVSGVGSPDAVTARLVRAIDSGLSGSQRTGSQRNGPRG